MTLLPHMLSKAAQSLPCVHTNQRAGQTGSRTTRIPTDCQKASCTVLGVSALNQEVLRLAAVTPATAVALAPFPLCFSPHLAQSKGCPGVD